LLEEIAETGAVEMELEVLRAGRSLASAVLPAGRRLETGAVLPARAQLVVLLALLWIAEDFIRFVDFLELFLGGLFVFSHIRVILAGQLAEGFFYVLSAGVARHAKGRVIIFEFNRHGYMSAQSSSSGVESGFAFIIEPVGAP